LKPWEQFFSNLAELFTLRAIITLAIVGIFVFLVLTGREITAEILTIFAVVITYWFCQRTRKRKDE